MARRELLLLLCMATSALSQDVISTVTACEAVRGLPDLEGKPLAIAGRYSMRNGAHWISQECGAGKSVKLRLLLDAQEAPHLPQNAALNERAAQEKLRQVHRSTSLEKFRFGSPDYDRWAVVFGSLQRSGNEFHLSYRGDGVVFFYPDN